MTEFVEAVSYAKNGDDALNEDAFVIENDIVAVFDGETNKGSPVVPSPGNQAVQALVHAVEDLPRSSDPSVVVKHLQAAVASVGGGPSVAAVGAVLDVCSRRLIRVGDVAVGIAGEFHLRRKLVDEVAAAARAAMLHSCLLDGRDLEELLVEDPGRKMILPLLRASRSWRNRADSAYGFASLDGGTTPDVLIDVFDIDRGAEVIMTTDGYTDPRSTLRESEEVLARSIRDDPLRIASPPGTKGVLPGNNSFDDRTYVRVKIG